MLKWKRVSLFLLSNCFVKSGGVETGRRDVSSGLF